MNQRTAVYNTVVTTLTNKGINFEKGQVAASMLSKEDHVQIRKVLCEGFTKGTIDLKSDWMRNDPSELNKYVIGLVNNWLRKDPELNGGNKYEAKNPGSRPADAQIRELKKFLAATTDEVKRTKIQEAIDKRQSEITKTTKKVEIDKSVLPEDIAALLDE